MSAPVTALLVTNLIGAVASFTVGVMLLGFNYNPLWPFILGAMFVWAMICTVYAADVD